MNLLSSFTLSALVLPTLLVLSALLPIEYSVSRMRSRNAKRLVSEYILEAFCFDQELQGQKKELQQSALDKHINLASLYLSHHN